MSFHEKGEKNKGERQRNQVKWLVQIEILGQILIVMWWCGNRILTLILQLMVMGWLVVLVIMLGQTVGCWLLGGGGAWRIEGGRPEELSQRRNLKRAEKHKCRGGGVAKRKTRRVVGDDVVNEIPVITSRNLRSLILKGVADKNKN